MSDYLKGKGPRCFTPLRVIIQKDPELDEVKKELFPKKRRVHFDECRHVQKTCTESENCLVPFNYGNEHEADEYTKQLKEHANIAHGSTQKCVIYYGLARHLRKLLETFSGNKEKIFALMCQLSPDRYHLGTSFVLAEEEARNFVAIIVSNARREVKKLWQRSCGEPERYGKHKLVNPKN